MTSMALIAGSGSSLSTRKQYWLSAEEASTLLAKANTSHLKKLLRNGLDPNQLLYAPELDNRLSLKQSTRWPLLLYACMYSSCSMVEVLLKSGADINATHDLSQMTACTAILYNRVVANQELLSMMKLIKRMGFKLFGTLLHHGSSEDGEEGGTVLAPAGLLLIRMKECESYEGMLELFEYLIDNGGLPTGYFTRNIRGRYQLLGRLMAVKGFLPFLEALRDRHPALRPNTAAYAVLLKACVNTARFGEVDAENTATLHSFVLQELSHGKIDWDDISLDADEKLQEDGQPVEWPFSNQAQLSASPHSERSDAASAHTHTTADAAEPASSTPTPDPERRVSITEHECQEASPAADNVHDTAAQPRNPQQPEGTSSMSAFHTSSLPGPLDAATLSANSSGGASFSTSTLTHATDSAVSSVQTSSTQPDAQHAEPSLSTHTNQPSGTDASDSQAPNYPSTSTASATGASVEQLQGSHQLLVTSSQHRQAGDVVDAESSSSSEHDEEELHRFLNHFRALHAGPSPGGSSEHYLSLSRVTNAAQAFKLMHVISREQNLSLRDAGLFQLLVSMYADAMDVRQLFALLEIFSQSYDPARNVLLVSIIRWASAKKGKEDNEGRFCDRPVPHSCIEHARDFFLKHPDSRPAAVLASTVVSLRNHVVTDREVLRRYARWLIGAAGAFMKGNFEVTPHVMPAMGSLLKYCSPSEVADTVKELYDMGYYKVVAMLMVYCSGAGHSLGRRPMIIHTDELQVMAAELSAAAKAFPQLGRDLDELYEREPQTGALMAAFLSDVSDEPVMPLRLSGSRAGGYMLFP